MLTSIRSTRPHNDENEIDHLNQNQTALVGPFLVGKDEGRQDNGPWDCGGLAEVEPACG
jgi:hypothetical protein